MSNGVCISVLFVAPVANIPLIYPAVLCFFNNEKQETGRARIESPPLPRPCIPRLLLARRLSSCLLFLRRAFTLEGSELVLSYVSLPGPQPF